MATPALTISDFNGKFQAIQSYITPDTLGLINGSETMKGLIRAYEADPNTRNVSLDNSSSAVFYPADQSKPATMVFGDGLLKNSIDAVRTISHELGHYDVDNPNGIVRKAWDDSFRSSDVSGLEGSCHMSEGYAKLATARVADDILNGGGNYSLATKARIGLWDDYVTYSKYKGDPSASSWTKADLAAAIARILADGNKSSTTSNSNEKYLDYCRNEALKALNRGANSTGRPAPAPVFSDGIDGIRKASIGKIPGFFIGLSIDKILELNNALNNAFIRARTFVLRRDPLAIPREAFAFDSREER